MNENINIKKNKLFDINNICTIIIFSMYYNQLYFQRLRTSLSIKQVILVLQYYYYNILQL